MYISGGNISYFQWLILKFAYFRNRREMFNISNISIHDHRGLELIKTVIDKKEVF